MSAFEELVKIVDAELALMRNGESTKSLDDFTSENEVPGAQEYSRLIAERLRIGVTQDVLLCGWAHDTMLNLGLIDDEGIITNKGREMYLALEQNNYYDSAKKGFGSDAAGSTHL